MIVARGKRPPISIIRSAGRGQSNLKLRIQDRKIACIRPFGLHFYPNSNQFYPRVKATERINHRKTTNEKNDTWNGPLVRHSGISFGWRGNNLRQQRLLLQLLHQPLRGGYGYDNRGNYYNYYSNPYGGSVYDNRGNYYNYYTNPW
jgi:hypothetical protein